MIKQMNVVKSQLLKYLNDLEQSQLLKHLDDLEQRLITVVASTQEKNEINREKDDICQLKSVLKDNQEI